MLKYCFACCFFLFLFYGGGGRYFLPKSPSVNKDTCIHKRENTFEVEMLIRIVLIMCPLNSCQIILSYHAINKSCKDLDDDFWRNYLTLMLLVANLAKYKMMQITCKMTETLAYGYSSESTQQELSNGYQRGRV